MIKMLDFDYSRVDWDAIKKHEGSVILVNINGPRNTYVLKDASKEEMLKVTTYVKHESNNFGSNGFVTLYIIQSRLLDDQDNLILLVKSKLVNYER
jgi:hypothetical protein